MESLVELVRSSEVLSEYGFLRAEHQTDKSRTRFKKKQAYLTAAAPGPRLYALTLTDRNCRLVVDSRGTHSLLDLPGHRQECLLNI